MFELTREQEYAADQAAAAWGRVAVQEAYPMTPSSEDVLIKTLDGHHSWIVSPDGHVHYQGSDLRVPEEER